MLRRPFDVHGTSRRLRRMLRNMLDNGLKHGAPPVEIEVRRGVAGGWGLGLSLVRQIARRHGGEATLDDVRGLTEFTVESPAA